MVIITLTVSQYLECTTEYTIHYTVSLDWKLEAVVIVHRSYGSGEGVEGGVAIAHACSKTYDDITQHRKVMLRGVLTERIFNQVLSLIVLL